MSISYSAGTVTISSATETIENVIDTVEAADSTKAHRDNNYGWINDCIIHITSTGTLHVSPDFEWAMRGSAYIDWDGGLILDERSVTRVEVSTRRYGATASMQTGSTFTCNRDWVEGVNPRIVHDTSTQYDFPTIHSTTYPSAVDISGLDISLSYCGIKTYFKMYFGNVTTVTDTSNIRYFDNKDTGSQTAFLQFYGATYEAMATTSNALISETTSNTITLNHPRFNFLADSTFGGTMSNGQWNLNNSLYPEGYVWDGTLSKTAAVATGTWRYSFTNHLVFKTGTSLLSGVGVHWVRADVGTPTFSESSTFHSATTTGTGTVEQLLIDAYNTGLTNAVDRYTWTAIARGYDRRSFTNELYTGRVVEDVGEVTEEFQLEDLTSTLGSISQSTASAYTGIAIVGGTTKTLTVTSASHEAVNIWAYYRDWISTLSDYSTTTDTLDSDGTNLYLNDWTYTNTNVISGTLVGGTINWSTAGTYTGGKYDSSTFDFTTNGTYNFGSSTFTGSTLNLDSSNNSTVTVQLDSGVLYNNLNPTYITVEQTPVYQGIEFTGLMSGSQIYIFETGTQTVVDYIESSSTSYTWQELYTGDQTVDYTIINEGYLPIRVTGISLSSSVVTVPVQQMEDRAYQTSSGLTFGTTATANTGTLKFGLTTASTLQNYYSFMMESWRSESTLKNVEFPISTNGPNSFTLEDGWEFDGSTSIDYLSRDGLRYVDAGTVTAIWSAIYILGDISGFTINYQQQDGTGTTTATTNDGLLQVYGDATHGNFDYTDHLVTKIQEDGYDQAEADIVSLYGILEDQLYIASMNPVDNGLTTGDPSVTGITITDHGATPVTWNSKDFSITITDSATPHTGEEIMRWLRYNFSLGGTFQGKDAFNWHDLVQTHGTKFKTVRGAIYGDVGATLKGVRVVLNDGTSPHPDFDQFTADDGTFYIPPTQITLFNTNLADGTRVRLYNVTQAAELDNSLVSGGSGYTFTGIVGVGEAIEEGDTIRMTSAYNSTTTYYHETDESAIAGTSNIQFLATQSNNTILNGYGIDGSARTEFSTDYVNVEIDISSGNTTRQALLCWLAYIITTADGIRNFFGAVTHEDAGNARINDSIVDLHLDYIGTGNSMFTDEIRLYREDGGTIFGGAGDNFYASSGKVFIAETGVSGLTPAESAAVLEITNIKTDTEYLIDIEAGDWELVNNQWIYKDELGNEVARYNTYDDVGLPSMDSVYKRVKV